MRIVIRLATLAILSLSNLSYAEDCVVLLHGLASHKLVMKPLDLALDMQPEFRTVNESYNSYADEIEHLALEKIPSSIEHCALQEDEQIHFVTHSMGGLLLRAYLAENQVAQLGRILMIAPPNHGSEIVDWLNQYTWLAEILGPAGKQLSTAENALPNQLMQLGTKQELELGIISGDNADRSLFAKVLPGKDDGKVSAKSAALDGMNDFITIEAQHTELLIHKTTIEQTLSFLRYGKFSVDQLPAFTSE